MGSQNVLDVNEPVLIVRPDDGPIQPKHVALYVLLMVITDVLDGNINTLFTQYLLVLFVDKICHSTHLNEEYIGLLKWKYVT